MRINWKSAKIHNPRGGTKYRRMGGVAIKRKGVQELSYLVSKEIDNINCRSEMMDFVSLLDGDYKFLSGEPCIDSTRKF
jgi:hypothetical protein